MNIIKIRLEYKCFPVWIYDHNNELIENDLPSELTEARDVESNFIHIQEIYDSLYLDDGKEFRYIGFSGSSAREDFFRELSEAIHLLKQKLNGEYLIEENLEAFRERVI